MKFNNAVIDNLSVPLSYTAATNTFAIYSEDYAYLGLYDITVDAYLTGYTTVSVGTPLLTKLEIIDPCLDPFSFSVPD